MRREEGLPGGPLTTLRCGFETVVAEDALDRVPVDLVSQVRQSVTNASVTPGRTISRHRQDELHDVLLRSRPPWAPLFRSVVLLRHEATVPSQDRVGRNDRGDLYENLSAHNLSLDRQTASLIVVKTNAAAAELLP